LVNLRLRRVVGAALAVACLATVLRAQAPQPQPRPADLGFTDTPMLPGMPWHVHDPARPKPPTVTPGAALGAPPSDAVVLFDGKDLSKWMQRGPKNEPLEPKWPIRDGYFETGAKTGSLYTRDSFGDVQLHVEWSAPMPVVGISQGRGNSGVLLMGLYEIQVLDMFDNVTYADGQAGAIYGQWPPLVSAPRKPGEWQTYDIIFEAPRFDGGKLVKPAFQTVLWNGVIVHNRKEAMGPMVYRDVANYKTPHAAELPLMLQDHNNPVRYRNIWIRRIGSYQ
jgi:hypothetical protein